MKGRQIDVGLFLLMNAKTSNCPFKIVTVKIRSVLKAKPVIITK